MIRDCRLPKQSDDTVKIVRSVHVAVGYYPARFPYRIALGFMGWLGGASRVLDPFVGSGVACTAARLWGHECVGFDINPFARLLARVSSSTLSSRDEEALARALRGLESYRGPGWRPRWGNVEYWHPPVVLEALERLWGYIHSLGDDRELYVCILKVALARVSRLFSYADPEIPKLYRGRGLEKLEALLHGRPPSAIEDLIVGRLRERVSRIVRALREYTRLRPRGPAPRLDELDLAREPLPQGLAGVDAVFTSPPYLAAHEYTRSTKLELYWLGYSDKEVRALRNKEIPYGPVEPYRVESPTFERLEEDIASRAPRLLALYRRYFWALARAFDEIARLGPPIIALFVGPATIASIPVPIHAILAEHLSTRGYTPLCRSVSAIRARKLFRRRNNSNPNGIQEETLIILSRKP
ncbi:MAG: site-specific DNA-methyltransferase [Desulfurococcales archaeon]|nr:site-specific DNA-methyltransferase [Desulfurococcales archaeon]